MHAVLCEPGEADDGSRTRDLELGKLALYQLSYVRVRAARPGAPDESNRGDTLGSAP